MNFLRRRQGQEAGEERRPGHGRERDWLDTDARDVTGEQYSDDAYVFPYPCTLKRSSTGRLSGLSSFAPTTTVPKAAIRTTFAAAAHSLSPAFGLLEKQAQELDVMRGWWMLKCGRGGTKGKEREVVVGSELAKEKGLALALARCALTLFGILDHLSIE